MIPRLKIGEGGRIMIASPNETFRQNLLEQIGAPAGSVIEAVGGADALAKLEDTPCDVLLLDRGLADLYPDELAELLRIRFPNLEVALVDAKEGIAKPEEDEHGANAEPAEAWLPAPSIAPGKDSEQISVEEEKESEPLPGMIGSSASMKKVFRLVRLVARRQTTVLITGETGTGKELVAQAIHELSPRAKGPFIAVNCAAIPETLIEAELFGHVRGAFTGAVQANLGHIHAAHGGTLFLDEAGDLPLSAQTKLLRFLQHGEVQRLGSSEVFRVDVRVVAATNANLHDRVARKDFRSDLFYRLAVFPLELPPLRQRSEDIVTLAMNFMERLARESGSSPKRLSAGAQQLLRRYAWPGNVRELQHAVERAFILSEERAEIPPEVFHLGAKVQGV